MVVAVLSDIHSNVFALRAVLRDLESVGVDEIWLGGDAFGYYPWAAETFRALDEVSTVAVLGNHDSWVLDADSAPPALVGEIACGNAEDLALHTPAALNWLVSLPPARSFEREGWKITIAHGTPDDPLEGRYYPDDDLQHSWLPRPNETLVLGHTHYPLLRGDVRTGLLLNPGSVGQPRDGNPMPSWALLDLATGRAELRRSAYDHTAVIRRLRLREWDDDVTRALGRERVSP
jgi:putative phosphoesterase